MPKLCSFSHTQIPIEQNPPTSAAAALRVPKPISEIPNLPKGKKMLETVVEKDVDSLFRDQRF